MNSEFLLNADFDQRATLAGQDYEWVPSPMAGVDRVKLDRIGGEVARATSLVRYVPNSSFSPHTHGGGEEFLVIDGVFSDEHGDYPAGTYVRNPVGSAHTPSIGEAGAMIFVKLHQFQVGDNEPKIINTQTANWVSYQDEVEQLELHQFKEERVSLFKIGANGDLKQDEATNQPAQEILILEGSIIDKDVNYSKGSWLRDPSLTIQQLAAGEDGALLFVKSGHLVIEEKWRK